MKKVKKLALFILSASFPISTSIITYMLFYFLNGIDSNFFNDIAGYLYVFFSLADIILLIFFILFKSISRFEENVYSGLKYGFLVAFFIYAFLIPTLWVVY